MSSLSSPPGVVLDTNVVFDWMVFKDPRCAPVVSAIQCGTIRWWAAQAFRDEFEAVLARGVGASHAPDRAWIDQLWAQHAEVLPCAPAVAPLGSCRCTDPDDQKFIDLALHHGARWLLSHDRAVLKVANQARRRGLLILPTSRWTLEPQASA
jgi:predicted nucleic acid-binding protein